jgi:type II secretory pathway component PulM
VADPVVDYQQMWIDLRGRLERTRDSGQRMKSVSALMEMDCLEVTEMARAAAAITRGQTKSDRELRRNRCMP